MRKAIITVADNMSDDTYSMLCNGVKRKFGGNIEFEKVKDNSVIGGFVLNLDGTVCDLSVRTQLAELERHIKK